MLKDDPDLMAEFLVFLPGHPSFMQHPEPASDFQDTPHWSRSDDKQATKKTVVPPKRKKRPNEKEPISNGAGRASPNKVSLCYLTITHRDASETRSL